MIMLDSPILFPWSLFLSHVTSVSPALLFPICSWWRWRDSEIVATKIEILLTTKTKKRWLSRHRLAESETQVAMRLAIHRHDTSSEWETLTCKYPPCWEPSHKKKTADWLMYNNIPGLCISINSQQTWVTLSSWWVSMTTISGENEYFESGPATPPWVVQCIRGGFFITETGDYESRMRMVSLYTTSCPRTKQITRCRNCLAVPSGLCICKHM